MRLMILLALACAVAAGEAPRTFPQIGVLNLEKVLHEAKIFAARRDEVKDEKAQAEAELAKLGQSIRQNENDLAALNRANPKASQLEDQLELDKMRHKQFRERAQANTDRRMVAVLNETYALIREHLKQFCVERGIKLVHLAPSPDLGNAPTPADIGLQLGMQSTLYYDPGLDLTDPFVSYLNATFEADLAKLQGGGAAAAPGPGGAPAQPAPAPAPTQPAGTATQPEAPAPGK